MECVNSSENIEDNDTLKVKSNPATKKLFNGVVIFLNDKDKDICDLKKQILSLGAKISPALSNEVTHVCFKDIPVEDKLESLRKNKGYKCSMKMNKLVNEYEHDIFSSLQLKTNLKKAIGNFPKVNSDEDGGTLDNLNIFEAAKKKFMSSNKTDGVVINENSNSTELFRTESSSKEVEIMWEDYIEPSAKRDFTKTDLIFSKETEIQEPIIKSENYIFQLSGFSPKEKNYYESILSNLGGDIVQSSVLHPTTTHLIIKNLKKSAKFLMGLAKGLMIINENYINMCLETKNLVDAKNFEWSKIETNKQKIKMALATTKWREKVQNDGCNAFSEWKVVLIVNNDRSEEIKELLMIGGASIMGNSIETVTEETTHILIDAQNSKIKELSNNTNKYDIMYKVDYISGFLIDGENSKFKYKIKN
ncbi:MAG: DNA topoisomerase 2-binding protein 1 [Paramarteilia canceri]